VQNNERYSAFPPAVSRAFLEVSDLRSQFISVYPGAKLNEIRKHHARVGSNLPWCYVLYVIKSGRYRGFIPKGDRVLGYNIIVVPYLRYGLKRCSGMLGSILDLNERAVQ
jgi:hypothetical protein